jgi:pimeloyl-ACP methyl ester carboxylesterase
MSVGGRAVAVWEYGAPAGHPVLVFHGTPACGAGFAWADEPARHRNLRLIAPDRPGIGRSARVAGWTVGDYPAMVAALADTLRIDTFAVWGYSGGGPYAVATACALGDRVTATSVASGMGQIGVWAATTDFEKTDRQFLELAPKHPMVARTMLAVTARLARLSPKGAAKSFEKQLSASDRAVAAQLGAPKDVMALFTRAFDRTAQGVVDDYIAISQAWDAKLEAATGPVHIFHGDADPMVPVAHAKALAEHMPGSKLTIWPGEGHLATVTHVGEVLDVLAPGAKP